MYINFYIVRSKYLMIHQQFFLSPKKSQTNNIKNNSLETSTHPIHPQITHNLPPISAKTNAPSCLCPISNQQKLGFGSIYQIDNKVSFLNCIELINSRKDLFHKLLYLSRCCIWAIRKI